MQQKYAYNKSCSARLVYANSIIGSANNTTCIQFHFMSEIHAKFYVHLIPNC